MKPISIQLDAPLGSSDGVLMASFDDWAGSAVIFPSGMLGDVEGLKEFHRKGIYILVSSKGIYVGQGDPVGRQINIHINSGFFWDKVIFFTDKVGGLKKSHLNHLVSRLVAIAEDAGRIAIENKIPTSLTVLSHDDNLFVDNFLKKALLMLPLLGFWHFSRIDEVPEPRTGKRAARYARIPLGMQFKLSSRNAEATLEVINGSVVIKKGSRVADTVTERFELGSPSYAALRRHLIESGVIVYTPSGMMFAKDQFFLSGSAAATVARGAASNADWWMNSQGKSLGEYIREAKSKA